MAYFEGYRSNKAWWFYAQLLIAEQKVKTESKIYDLYCEEFIEFLQLYGPPIQQAKSWEGYNGTKQKAI